MAYGLPNGHRRGWSQQAWENQARSQLQAVERAGSKHAKGAKGRLKRFKEAVAQKGFKAGRLVTNGRGKGSIIRITELYQLEVAVLPMRRIEIWSPEIASIAER